MFDFTPLSVGVMKVVFEKLDGTMRTMLCTRKPELVEVAPKTSTPLEECVAKGYVRAFDTEKKAWRSFRIESVKTAEVVV